MGLDKEEVGYGLKVVRLMMEMAGLEVGSWWAGLEAIIEHSLAKLFENYDNLNSIVSS